MFNFIYLFVFKNISIVRYLMHKELNKFNFLEPVIDIGAGKQSYLSDFSIKKKLNNIKIVTIDRIYNSDIISDLEKDLPLNSDYYKTVLLLNVLDLVYNYDILVAEIYRILKTKGKLFIWVPFLINIHNDPVDYFRFTDNGLKNILRDANFKQFEIQPIGGIFLVLGTYLSQLFYFIPPLAGIISIFFILNQKILNLFVKKNACKWPLAYKLVAIK